MQDDYDRTEIIAHYFRLLKTSVNKTDISLCPGRACTLAGYASRDMAMGSQRLLLPRPSLQVGRSSPPATCFHRTSASEGISPVCWRRSLGSALSKMSSAQLPPMGLLAPNAHSLPLLLVLCASSRKSVPAISLHFRSFPGGFYILGLMLYKFQGVCTKLLENVP